MDDIRWVIKKYGIWIILLILVLFAGCMIWQNLGEKDREDSVKKTDTTEEAGNDANQEKGYDLPVDEKAEEKAVKDGKEKMMDIKETYQAFRGAAETGVLPDVAIQQMAEQLEKDGNIVVEGTAYEVMHHYEKMDVFLGQAAQGKKDRVTIYELRENGDIGRSEYIYDGKDMYVLNTGFSWGEDDDIAVSDSTLTRMEWFTYTEKGWFLFEYCVPQPPDVTEVIDGHDAIRVKPLEERNREISEKYLFPIGYQSSNLLWSDWDSEHKDKIDYNALFESFYEIKYQETFPVDKYADGIPKEEFEAVMKEYLPVSGEDLQRFAVFDAATQRYAWNEQDYRSNDSGALGLSLPEVIGMRGGKDGTIVLTVDAVCKSLGSDRLIRHEMIVRQEGEMIKYLSNRILENNMETLPEYHYRTK
ncbi:hypothetical protein B5F37_02780 [Drancourtella sp. An210]|nr:hypothetical protein B5F37_02780 [Drancourtella sp. An210]